MKRCKFPLYLKQPEESFTLQADPYYDLRELTRIIETDPSIAARIMGWANSSFHNAKPQAKSIEDAVVRILGADTAMSMALGIAIGKACAYRVPTSVVCLRSG